MHGRVKMMVVGANGRSDSTQIPIGVWLDWKLRENVQMKRIREKAEEWTGKTEWMSGVNGQIANCC